jgi:hypothetical protein
MVIRPLKIGSQRLEISTKPLEENLKQVGCQRTKEKGDGVGDDARTWVR